MCVCSVMSHSATPQNIAHQAPLSVEFPRQEYWSGVSFPIPGDLPDPGIEPASLALVGVFFSTEPPGKLVYLSIMNVILEIEVYLRNI